MAKGYSLLGRALSRAGVDTAFFIMGGPINDGVKAMMSDRPDLWDKLMRKVRRVTAVGGFYTFITRGLGSVMGMGAGYLIAFCYIIFAAAVTGVGSYFASTSVEAWFGISIPAWAYEALFLALMTAFAWFHIELTAKILGVALVSEVLVMLILAFAILVQGGPDGFSAAPLNPANIFDNEAALKVFGAAAAGVAIFGAFWSWVGFEMAPNYAEESREPHKIAKRALYISVISLGVFYTFVSYMFVTGWGLTGSAQAVSDQFDGKYASAFYPLSDKFVGSGLTTMIEILIITSSFACSMAFYNTGSRYLFSLAREGLLPAALGRTHPTQKGPVNASMVVTAIVGVYMLAFTLSDPSTLAALLKLGTWTPLLGVLGILAVQGLCSLAIIRYFRTEAADVDVGRQAVAIALRGHAGQVRQRFGHAGVGQLADVFRRDRFDDLVGVLLDRDGRLDAAADAGDDDLLRVGAGLGHRCLRGGGCRLRGRRALREDRSRAGQGQDGPHRGMTCECDGRLELERGGRTLTH